MNIRKNVYLTGDIGIDLLVINKKKYQDKTILQRLGIETKKYYFMTCHRAANTDDPHKLRGILEAIAQLTYPVIFPIHPRTKARIEVFGLNNILKKPHIQVIEPIGFWDTQALIHYSKMVLTDSGGVVKEAYFHKVPCIIVDKQIEWIEAVEEGWTKLAGTNANDILQAAHTFTPPSVSSHFLGRGKAAQKIVKAIQDYLKVEKNDK